MTADTTDHGSAGTVAGDHGRTGAAMSAIAAVAGKTAIDAEPTAASGATRAAGLGEHLAGAPVDGEQVVGVAVGAAARGAALAAVSATDAIDAVAAVAAGTAVPAAAGNR